MGIFSRMSDIMNSNVHAMLDKAEDPEKMVRLIIQEMEDTLVEVRSTAVRAIARKKEIGRHVSVLHSEVSDWQSKAELAISKDREDLARAALVAKNRAAERADELTAEAKVIDEEINKLDEDTATLKAKLKDAKARQKAMILRQQSAASRLKVKQQVNDTRMQDAMLKFEAYENRIDGLEAQVESYDLGQPKSLQEEFSALETDDKIEGELAALKANRKKSAATGEKSDASSDA